MNYDHYIFMSIYHVIQYINFVNSCPQVLLELSISGYFFHEFCYLKKKQVHITRTHYNCFHPNAM